ncbi:hypothetical protein LUZ62_016328 [Rhynchospora pubera]|uniref:DUF599 domain-containing protein n=1 Tax=Rhynchospora pubera TaxID=906938 RepID=A0AAV8DZP7_9POAL|nr:hypothetical protein LUZ62_058990 [Rhynchospora pubera]KAJ4783904.1 hypothetical protein LUZ62_035150 [Rhynchospora pubera]KAJ4803762.1 hypothetical protein LUZ62_016328 [Rhynchospora pubera]
MNKQELDCVLVPIGILALLGYHLWLLYRVVKHPSTTVIGINSMNRRLWVQFVMQDPAKYGVLAVQSLRNNIMASTLLASTAIMLSSIIAILMTNNNGATTGGIRGGALILGNTTQLGLSVKCFSILVCFLLAFFLNLQSIRYYSHGSILINVPFSQLYTSDPLPAGPAAKYVANVINRGSYFWSLGLRALYFSLPIFLWIFGPIPMLACCLMLVSVLYFLDVYTKYDVGDANTNSENHTCHSDA